MFIKSVFVLMLLWSVSATAYVRIGNGGEGVLENGQIYVRDLYEQKSHLNPWFGTKSSISLREAWNKTNLEKYFSEERSLVLRKLTDIENVYPGLGFATLEALDKYVYLFVDKLELLENDSPSVPDSQRVQIAIRRYKTVYISNAAWKKMSPESKAALLIHEGVYGLARVTCNQNICEQKSREVRPVVGQLFFSVPEIDLKKSFHDVLEIKSLENLCALPLAWFQFSVVSENDRTHVYQSFQSQYHAFLEDLKKDVQKVCQIADQYKDNKVVVMYDSQIFLQSLDVNIYTMDIQGDLQTQQGFFTRRLQNHGRKFISFASVDHCETRVLHLIHQSLMTQKKMAGIDPSVVCASALSHRSKK
ncbi:hypothetical protein QJS83_09450 [Bdellovibrio sp. 22V]|uniref:hypothetical protein n=1 Tax=Bdellovibrio sp. 22V TaxID=3044166 RepID=UPI0025437EC6|nr:hypothetical protein [Bdellovibrio sp. 22V]WII70683.1 hypothetical protein QJS83_09450 [Bdellovibrio sp. 22V]